MKGVCWVGEREGEEVGRGINGQYVSAGGDSGHLDQSWLRGCLAVHFLERPAKRERGESLD